ncbi:hypothetical protein AOQ73_18270 [Bradyrhizobium pachyrhizi]|nr:hypothetical protein AOQ73_18270 [Bradyrhizobium pachyrhizi]
MHQWQRPRGFSIAAKRRKILPHEHLHHFFPETLMAIDDLRPCPCGSGLASRWVNDARGIPLARVCPQCEDEKLSHYRPEVLTNSNYDADEDIDGD